MRISKPNLIPVVAFASWLLLALAVSGCDSGKGSGSPTEAPPPPRVNLAGSWAGTMTVTFDEIDGGGSCMGPITATFEQTDTLVSGPIAQARNCVRDDARFEGTLRGAQFSSARIINPGDPQIVWTAAAHISGHEVWIQTFNVRWLLHR